MKAQESEVGQKARSSGQWLVSCRETKTTRRKGTREARREGDCSRGPTMPNKQSRRKKEGEDARGRRKRWKVKVMRRKVESQPAQRRCGLEKSQTRKPIGFSEGRLRMELVKSTCVT